MTTRFSPAVAAWEHSGKYHRIGKHEIFYREAGTGPTLLLIHGFPTSSFDWWPIWPTLIKHYRVIACDMLGFGFSDKPNARYSLLKQADLHEALLQHLNVEQYHLLAHDYGVSVGQELLARGADIASVTWLNGGLFPEQHRPIFTQKILNSPIGGLAARLFNERKFIRGMKKVWGPKPSKAEFSAFWELIEHKQGTRIAHRLIRYIEDRKQHRDRWVGALQLASQSIPMLLINGTRDPVSGAHLADYFSTMCPAAKCARLDHVGHYPQVEAPDEVLQLFLDSFCG